MPELPDIHAYLHALEPRILGKTLEAVRIRSPFLVRSVSPPVETACGREVTGVERIGKRVVTALEGDLFLVFHLMIAGRFRWKPAGAAILGKLGLAAFDFSEKAPPAKTSPIAAGTLLLTEAGTKKRASLLVIEGRKNLAAVDRGGTEPLECTPAGFRDALLRENHTLKRSLTDPRLFSGIGNAYSDEILHHAGLSPLKLTSRLGEDEIDRLYRSTREVLARWMEKLVEETGDGFPEKVTAFREDMAVHGKYGKPCPVCAAPIQRIVYAANACNYCARCQTGGRVLADRALSRLLKKDWPRRIEELENRDPG